MSRAPWSSGRVSSGSASSRAPRAWSSPITPSAVPRSTAASAPVLQIVIARTVGRATSSAIRSAPRVAMAAQAAMSSSRIRRASDSTAPCPSGRHAQRAVDAPGEVDRRRAGIAQALRAGSHGTLVVRVARGQERDPEPARHAQRRSAAHREPRDRIDQLVELRDAQHDQLVGQARLVDEVDLPVDPVDGPHGRPIFAGTGRPEG